jgi:TRAP-type C4-dicarboxylate transport system permease large subunit
MPGYGAHARHAAARLSHRFEMGLITPPFGMLLFVMKGVAPEEISIEEICRAAFPFILCDGLAMTLIIIFPALALWLPSHVI